MSAAGPLAALAERLRAAGSVFAEEEAAILLEGADDPAGREERIRRREAGEPLEHIVGWVDFGGRRLSVGPGVFVPRQRTLLLARAAVRAAAAAPAPVVVEPFCGAAPVASAVAAAVPGAEVHAADIDPVALVHARRNLPDSAGVHRSDGLVGLPPGLRGRVTVLAAVPPYVPAGQAHLLPRDATEHEPERALVGGADGLAHVRALVGVAGEWLAPGGRLLVELHRGQYGAAAAPGRATGLVARRRAGRDGQTVLLDLHRPLVPPTRARRLGR